MQPLPRIIFASENIQLGGLLAVALARLHRERVIHLEAIWSSKPPKTYAPLGAQAHKNLLQADTIQRMPSFDGVLLGGVMIADFPQLAHEMGIAYRHVPDVNGRHVAATLCALDVTLGVSCGHSQYFRRPLRNAPRMGWVNCHPSLLPKHRGPYPGFWELKGGDKKTGISVHKLNSKFDTGPVIGKFPIPLEHGVSFSELVRRQGEVCGKRVPGLLVKYLRGEVKAKKQRQGGSYESAPIGEDFVITHDMACDAIGRFVPGMKEIGAVMARIDGHLVIVESVLGWQTYPLGAEGVVAYPTPFAPKWIAPTKIEFPAKDGIATLLVREATVGDFKS